MPAIEMSGQHSGRSSVDQMSGDDIGSLKTEMPGNGDPGRTGLRKRFTAGGAGYDRRITLAIECPSAQLRQP